MSIDWDAFPNFSPAEFKCKCGCEQVNMDSGFMAALQRLRLAYGRPMVITSGYRCHNHPEEARKIAEGKRPGAHSHGVAADIAVSLGASFTLLRYALISLEFTGIGVHQKGDGRFLHLDSATVEMLGEGSVRPTTWSY